MDVVSVNEVLTALREIETQTTGWSLPLSADDEPVQYVWEEIRAVCQAIVFTADRLLANVSGQEMDVDSDDVSEEVKKLFKVINHPLMILTQSVHETGKHKSARITANHSSSSISPAWRSLSGTHGWTCKFHTTLWPASVAWCTEHKE